MKNEEKKHLVNIQLDRAEVFVFGSLSLCIFTWFGILFLLIFREEKSLQYWTIP